MKIAHIQPTGQVNGLLYLSGLITEKQVHRIREAAGMPAASRSSKRPGGYRFDFDPDTVARAVLGKSIWAVLALTLDIELFTQANYRQSIDHDTQLSELFNDVFLYHWKEECQHALLDELEFLPHDSALKAEERNRTVDDFIELVAAVDGILQAQAAADAAPIAVERWSETGREAAFLAAYRWQYISDARHPHFGKVLTDLITESQGQHGRM